MGEHGNLLSQDFTTTIINEETIIQSQRLPLYNVCMESFYSIMKKEEIHHVKYYDFKLAKHPYSKYSLVTRYYIILKPL